MKRKRKLRNGWAQCNVLVPPDDVGRFHKLAKDARDGNITTGNAKNLADDLDDLRAGQARLEDGLSRLEAVLSRLGAMQEPAKGSRHTKRDHVDTQLTLTFPGLAGSPEATNATERSGR